MMMTYPRLTQQQRELLFWLVEEANQDVNRPFSFRVEQVYYATWNLFLPKGERRERIIIADLLQLRELRYVTLQETEREEIRSPVFRFVQRGEEEPPPPPTPKGSKRTGYQGALTQQAFDYYKWEQLPKWRKMAGVFLSSIKGDVRTIIVSVVAAIITTIITIILLNILGVAPNAVK